MKKVKEQYSLFPYPSSGIFHFPKIGRKNSLSYDFLMKNYIKKSLFNSSINILIIGSGTSEALAVALQNLKAKSIVALDISDNSLRILKKKYVYFSVLLSVFTLGFIKLPELKTIANDFLKEKIEDNFDYIIATNSIHHMPNNEKVIQKISQILNEKTGIFRMTTYPRYSRLWIDRLSVFFKINNLNINSQKLLQKAKKSLKKVKYIHPLYQVFSINDDFNNVNGLVDASFNACINSKSPMIWGELFEKNHLECCHIFGVDFEDSELIKKIKNDSPYLSLEFKDRVFDLMKNPTFILKKFSDVDAKRVNYEDKYKIFLNDFTAKNQTYSSINEVIFKNLSLLYIYLSQDKKCAEKDLLEYIDSLPDIVNKSNQKIEYFSIRDFDIMGIVNHITSLSLDELKRASFEKEFHFDQRLNVYISDYFNKISLEKDLESGHENSYSYINY